MANTKPTRARTGIEIRHRKGCATERARRCNCQPGYRAEVFDARSWLAVACVGVATPLLGWLLGGRDIGRRRAFALGADARELGLALMMASFAFPQPNVHGALVGVALIFALGSFLLALATGRLGRRTSAHRPPPMGEAKPARMHA